jgi:hypothetical protein
LSETSKTRFLNYYLHYPSVLLCQGTRKLLPPSPPLYSPFLPPLLLFIRPPLPPFTPLSSPPYSSFPPSPTGTSLKKSQFSIGRSLEWSLPSRVSSKQTKIIFGSNRNKICFAFVSVCFVKPKTKSFGLFRCFEPISKQTELFRNKPKQTETNLNFLKNTRIYYLLNCLGGSSVCLETSKHSVSV